MLCGSARGADTLYVSVSSLSYAWGADLTATYTVTAQALRRLAAAAHVAAPGIEVSARSRRIARVVRRRDGFRVVMGPVLLTAPEPVLMGVLAHEVAHIALGHPAMLRRLRVAVGAVVVLISTLLFFLAVFILQGSGNAWLWAIEAVALLAVMLAPRVVLLAVVRRYEYRADQTAAELLGSSGPVIAVLDWLPTVGRDDRWPLPVRPWTSAHPSTAARRQAMLRHDVDLLGQASEGR